MNELYDESIWLLYHMLGWGNPPKISHLNTRASSVYEQKLSLRTMSRIASTLADSCLPDIYDAARERFEHIYGIARAYCSNQQPCDLATSKTGRLWTPFSR